MEYADANNDNLLLLQASHYLLFGLSLNKVLFCFGWFVIILVVLFYFCSRVVLSVFAEKLTWFWFMNLLFMGIFNFNSYFFFF